MTFLYPDMPPTEAEPAVLATPKVLTTPNPGPSGEIIRHVIIGSPEAVRETIRVLHMRHYAQQTRWTGPVEIGPDGVNITQSQGQVLFYLTRLRALEVIT